MVSRLVTFDQAREAGRDPGSPGTYPILWTSLHTLDQSTDLKILFIIFVLRKSGRLQDTSRPKKITIEDISKNGFRENLQQTPIFNGKNHGFSCRCSLKPIQIFKATMTVDSRIMEEPWYRWPIEIDGLPWFTVLKNWWIFHGYVK